MPHPRCHTEAVSPEAHSPEESKSPEGHQPGIGQSALKHIGLGHFEKLLDKNAEKFKITNEDYKVEFRKKQKFKLSDILEVTKKRKTGPSLVTKLVLKGLASKLDQHVAEAK